ncbi:MAG: glycosyltransferase family 39 protein [Planctomycetes bacterium]|nr:glycosyltransferase family 39 protein [Planctomycetota bacterium]
MELLSSDLRIRPGWILLILICSQGLLCGLFTCGDYHLSRDSFDYLLLARNWMQGDGFALAGNPEVYRPPGFPVLISSIASIFKSLELCGHLVSLLAGLLCLPVFYWVAKKVLSPPLALFSVCLFGLNGFFIQSGSEVLTETTATLFLLLAVGFLIDAHLHSSAMILSSVLFGFFAAGAYLVRMELILFFPAGLLLLLFKGQGGKVRRGIGSFLAALALIVCCLPYWNLLADSMNRFSLGGGGVNLIWYQSDAELRPPESLDPRWAPRPFDPRFPDRTHPVDFSPVKYAAINFPELTLRYLKNGLAYLGSACELCFFGLGIPFLLIGLFRIRRVKRPGALPPLLFVFFPALALAFRPGSERLLLPYLPYASLFMAVGLMETMKIAGERFSFTPERTRLFFTALVVIMLLIPLAKFGRHLGREEKEINKHYREAGVFIAEWNSLKEPPLVMACASAIGFYAGGDAIAVPDTDQWELVTVQMKRYGATFLVLEKGDVLLNVPSVASLQEMPLELLKTFPSGFSLYALKD